MIKKRLILLFMTLHIFAGADDHREKIQKCVETIEKTFKVSISNSAKCFEYGFMQIKLEFLGADKGKKYYEYLYGNVDVSDVSSPANFCKDYNYDIVQEIQMNFETKEDCLKNLTAHGFKAHGYPIMNKKQAFKHMFYNKVLTDFVKGSFTWYYYHQMKREAKLSHQTLDPFFYCKMNSDQPSDEHKSGKKSSNTYKLNVKVGGGHGKGHGGEHEEEHGEGDDENESGSEEYEEE